MRRSAAAMSLVLAAAAHGQFGTSAVTFAFPLRWEEVNGNANGVLEPGESARLRFDVSITPAVNTIIPFFDPPGGTGVLRGVAGALLDLSFQNAGGGTFQLDGVTAGIPNGLRPEWNLVGTTGNGYYSALESAVRNIQVGQFPRNASPYDPVLNPLGTREENPIENVYTMVWTPNSYSPRSATVSVVLGSTHTWVEPAVVVQTNPDPSVAPGIARCYGAFTYGSVHIPVVPAPASGLLAVAVVVLGARRRER